ncbi:HD domain-containing protein [Lachnotalea glycerini]|uniref:HD domain-containing protein n=1 Tax=Lachnotalea glycerini TaxID=1763509 RepID=A0A318EV25_9FIRM|nr:HD domain-containing phosphohydrolase [Lachnotalea glycerini]PXV96082.1 HD domain-containing protein [Lachnotalea glycerini]
MDIINISLFALLKSISDAQDLISPLLSNHQQQVAYLSYRLCEKLNMSKNEQRDTFLAGLVHDIGALSRNERLEIIEREPMLVNNHAFIGAKLLQEFEPMKSAALIIKFHHLAWNDGKGSEFYGERVPFGSHIIHLADRVCTMIKPDVNILSQIPRIAEYIKERSNTMYVPAIVEAFEELSIEEYIWFDLKAGYPVNKVDVSNFDIQMLSLDDLLELTQIFSYIIDFRSRFTARHSAGVANIAKQLAILFDFPAKECKMMLVAGYLHDLGKLAIDNEILEKQGKLSDDEFNQVRSHTYYTYQLLDSIPELQEIKEWAAYHHERIDGKGYPFHIKGDKLSLGSRIMAVADVFTAITEDRPYRKGMDESHAVKVLNGMVQNGALAENVVSVLIDNMQMINELREQSQVEAARHYESFLQC